MVIYFLSVLFLGFYWELCGGIIARLQLGLKWKNALPSLVWDESA